MLGLSSKRQRESDELVDALENVAHGSKKPRPLVLRTSLDPFRKFPSAEDHQTPPRVNLPTLTPAESSDEDEGRYTGTLHRCLTGVASRLHHSPQTFKSTAPLYSTAMDIDGEKEIKRQTNNEITHTWPGSGKNNGSFQPSPISNHFRINQFLSFTEQPNTLSTYKKLQDQENQREDPAFRKDLLSSWSDQRFPSPISENNNVMTCDKFPNSDIEMTSSASRSASSALFASQVGPKLQHDPNSYQGPPQQDLLSINALGQGQQLISRPNTPSRKKKVTLSMGFRADCDKCLHKVPGHYSHIIRT